MNLSDFAAASNEALVAIISNRIREQGPIPFAEFMSLALYHPQHGYYVTCDPSRDYQSSPNVHPVFAAVLARQLEQLWQRLGSPARFDVVEAAAANGRLATDILDALQRSAVDLYEAISYTLIDVTYGAAACREAALASLSRHAGKIGLTDALPTAASIEGCILSNELFDAIPFHRVRKHDGSLSELRVGLEGGRFVDVEAPLSNDVRRHFDTLGIEPGEGCDAEACPEASAWLTQAAASLRRGFVLTLDYGYEAAELYASWRKAGTLLTFYRHTSGDDPYTRIGRQDITASVDFTSLIRAGEGSGLRTELFTTQAEYLSSMGMGDPLQDTPAPDQIEAYYGLRRAVMELTDTAGLGRIRVLLQSKGVTDGATET